MHIDSHHGNCGIHMCTVYCIKFEKWNSFREIFPTLFLVRSRCTNFEVHISTKFHLHALYSLQV